MPKDFSCLKDFEAFLKDEHDGLNETKVWTRDEILEVKGA